MHLKNYTHFIFSRVANAFAHIRERARTHCLWYLFIIKIFMGTRFHTREHAPDSCSRPRNFRTENIL